VNRELIAARLEGFDRIAAPDDHGLRHAAVAVVVLDDASFLLTRRATGLRAHPGQWALPGGRLDAGETAVDAARRELAEEVGVHLDAGSVLGVLDDYCTRSGFAITPVVLWAPAAIGLTPDPREVAAVHRIPLSELERDDSPRFVPIPESDRLVVQVGVLGDWIHAPTAAVLHQFAEVCLAGRDTRVADLEQPVWAW
jgi:8-oxo-dGTP pyrophosphatase MutT (NUDIX family)